MQSFSRNRWQRQAASLRLFALFLVAGPFLLPYQLSAQTLPLRTVCTMPTALVETSGLIATGPNRIWSHNDSGGEAKLYELDTTGTILRTISLRGISNVDWEDITQDQNGNVYVGDFGNNDNNRTNLVIYKLPALDSIVGDSVTPTRIDFHYDNQFAFPPADPLKNFDMEAMVAKGDSLYLFSKNRTNPFDGFTKLYRLPNVAGNYAAELVDSFYTGAGPMLNYWVCGAALSPSQDQLMLVSYGNCWLFSCYEGADFFGGAVVHFNMAFSQKEAVAWYDNTHLYMTDELLNGFLGGKLYAADLTAYSQMPVAALGPDTTFYGDSLILQATNTLGASYLWSNGATSSAITIQQSGSYWLQVTAANGCQAGDTIQVDILAGLEKAPEDNLRIKAFPNPSAGPLSVQLIGNFSTEIDWTLMDMQGSIHGRGRQSLAPSGKGTLIFADLAPGLYCLKFQGEQGSQCIMVMMR